MDPLTPEGRTRLARHLLTLAFASVPEERRPPLVAASNSVRARLERPVDRADAGHLLRLTDMEDLSGANRLQRRALLRVFGLPRVQRARDDLPDGERRESLARTPTAVLLAAVRITLDPKDATQHDITTLTRWVRKEGRPAVAMDEYVAEARGLPPGFDTDEFVGAVTARLAHFGGAVEEPFVAVTVGRLLLDGATSPARSDFRHAVKRSYDQGVAETPQTDVPNKELYEKIVGDVRELRPNQKIRFQELAAVADHVIAAAEEWDVTDTDTRRAQVDVGLLRYADGTADTGFAALELPAIVSEDASNQEIEPMNVQAVGMIAAAFEIEQTGAFDVVDRMVELFMQGMLPVRDDSGGRALNRYFWQSEDRLDATARSAQYARALGRGDPAPGDAQPNSAFDPQLMRFVSSLVRYDNDLQVSTVVRMDGADRPGSSELVRKSAQDLAASASLYGWGFTVFAARRLSRHIELVFDVLGQETLQRAYGVTGPWQLVERVSAVEFGSTPSIVAHRTRAAATKDLLDLLAGYATDLSRSGAVRRFLPSADDLRGRDAGAGPTVVLDDYERMVTAANNLLAVAGLSTEEISKLAAPVASAARGSIPTVGGDGSADSAGIDQIRQLVAQGQTPSLDQLQRLLPLGTGALG